MVSTSGTSQPQDLSLSIHIFTIDNCFHVFRALHDSFSCINGGFQDILIYLLVIGRACKSFVRGYNALADEYKIAAARSTVTYICALDDRGERIAHLMSANCFRT
jgi:hypothetical protein